MRTRMLTAIPLLLFTLASGGCHHAFGSKAVHADGWKVQENNEVYVIHRRSQYRFVTTAFLVGVDTSIFVTNTLVPLI